MTYLTRLKIIFISLFILLTLFILPVAADNCNRARTVYQTYSAPTYYPTTYYPPTNYYQPNYYKEQVILVPKAIEVEVHRDHYYSIDTYYQQNLLADAIVGRLLSINLKSELKSNNVNRSVASSTNNVASSTNNVAPNNTAFNVNGLSTYQNQDLSVALKNNCTKCHDGKVRTAFLSPEDKLLDLPKCKVLEVYHLTNTGKMPKGSSPLEDKYMVLIDGWVEASK